MYVRLAQFEGEPDSIDQMVAGIRENLESGETPPGLEEVGRVMVLVNRGSGKTRASSSARRRTSCARPTKR